MKGIFFWTYEKLFKVNSIHRHQKDCIYAVKNSDIPLCDRLMFRRYKSNFVMVWARAVLTVEKNPLIPMGIGGKYEPRTC